MTEQLKRCRILGVDICVTNLSDAAGYIINNISKLSGRYICLCNVHTAVTAYEDAEYAAVENGAALVFADGKPVAEEQRKRGFEEAERVAGPDLMKALFEATSDGSLRHYFYGASEETLQALKENLNNNYPHMQIAGMYSPPYRPLSKEEDDEAVAGINAVKPDIVWIGLGAPKQEKWMAAHVGRISGVMLGVGAGFDFHAGTVKRAPVWMQKAGLEWFYRLTQDPGHLLKRYFHTNTKYMRLIKKDRELKNF